jgi:3-oxoacyl-[acyl-carrier protein] reductase
MTERAFTGKVVIIAGNGGELGFALARAFAEAGSQAVVVAAFMRGLESPMLSTLQNEGLAVHYEEIDARDPVQCNTLVEQVVERFGHVDVLVNASSMPDFDFSVGAAESLQASAWEESLAATLSAAFYCAQAAGNQMLKQGYGVIANLTSVYGLKVSEGHVTASVVHAALVALTKALGVEWAGRGVRMVGVALPLALGEPSRRTPLRSGVTAQQIAETLLYLTSDEAAYVTAETIPVDGGWTAYQLF